MPDAEESGANYAYLGNTAGSNISVLKACETAGVDVQFLGNVWGMDENAVKAAGEAADGVVFPLRTAVDLGRQRARHEDLDGHLQDVRRGRQRRIGRCTTSPPSARRSISKEAMDWAGKNGGVTGREHQEGLYQKKDWVPAGMEGVCNAVDLDRDGPPRAR